MQRPETPRRPPSTVSATPSIVPIPRKERRGLFATLTLLPEVTHPRDYSNKTKWILTAQVALAGACSPVGSAVVMPALLEISRDLNSTPTIANLSVAVYMLSLAFFPLWWSSFSETLGRRTVYIISFALFTLFAILSAVATNIAMLITMRVFSGGAAASVQAVGAGSIADIWEPKERGRAMGIFFLGPLCGPLIAPIIGGVLTEAFNWRATQWFLVIYGGVVLVFLTLFLPETLPRQQTDAHRRAQQATHEDLHRVSTRQSVQQKTKRSVVILRHWFIDPLSIVLYIRFPAVFTTVIYASISFGCLYFLNISIQETFGREPYNFSTLIVGLLYIPNSLGYILAALFGGRWIDHIMKREATRAGRYDEKGKLVFQPEDRMRENAYLAGFLFPGALLWYGWTAHKGVIWIVPMIANFFFGIGSMLVFTMATTMLTEFMPRNASAGIAVNNFVRNIFSFVGGVVAEPLIRAIGNGWLFTILAAIAFITCVASVYSMKKFGPKWRVAMQAKMRS
ncbi:putative MFS multidrug resistance transporter [Lineolata rhizophorae]|uniref:Putative MFS multidrug resistance transporter n=1 Tax=Lineolata rhizophorae TaxID=578093 RepID=A0A6A6P4I0_9PEZI|nr:putative MFS multidrug resistance transporter [Lineolata rhizophorae]